MTRDILAVVLTITGGTVLTVGGFLLSPSAGCLALGIFLALTGYVVGQE